MFMTPAAGDLVVLSADASSTANDDDDDEFEVKDDFDHDDGKREHGDERVVVVTLVLVPR
jgi:hypothetical protein